MENEVIIKDSKGNVLSKAFSRSTGGDKNGRKVRNTLATYILRKKGYGYNAIASFLGVSQRTLYRYRKEISTVEKKTQSIQNCN